MTSTTAQLGPLISELHEINRELVDATKPLDRLQDLDQKARDQLASKLRAGLARWEDLTRKIHHVLEQDGTTGAVPPC